MKSTKHLYIALASVLAASFGALIIGVVTDISMLVGVGALLFALPGTILMVIISEIENNNRTRYIRGY